MQNNMDYIQTIFGAEVTHVEHDVPTYVLQHLISDNRHMLL